MGFPGACVRCGGPQVWTLHAGDIWVACKHDCLSDQLMLDGTRNPPLISLCSEPDGLKELEETEGGKGTPEGRESNTSGISPTDDLPW